MLIKDAKFVISNTDFRKCPPPDKPEFAFIGRSNVGKSSLINMLCERKSLAKISVRPGKTRLINHFIINNTWYLVDLPGYGYAKVSKTSRAKWQKMINGYLINRLNLMNTFILIDLRIPPQNNDLEMINSFGLNELPFAIIFTKADKLKKQEIDTNISLFRNTLLEKWEELPPIFISSAVKRTGRDEILTFIGQTLSAFDPESLMKKLP